jgi:hypothetical protein
MVSHVCFWLLLLLLGLLLLLSCARAPQDCTFIRAASPLISRQLLPSTADKGAPNFAFLFI